MASFGSSKSGHAGFPDITLAQSLPIHIDNTIVGVIFTPTETILEGNIVYYVGYCTSVDGVYTWEMLDRADSELVGNTHTFATSGEYFVKWKANGLKDNTVDRLTIKIVR